MVLQHFTYVCVLSVIFLLSGCASQGLFYTRTDSNQGMQRSVSQDGKAELQSWCIVGRSAVKYDDSGWQADVRWCFSGIKTTLQLTGPVNLNRVVISYYPGELRIQESKDQLTISHTPERMLKSRLGFSVPLSAFRYWLQGVAEPGEGMSQKYDNEGRLHILEQHGWVVTYSAYMLSKGYMLPRKIKLNNDMNSVRLKIVVDRWVLEK